ncbi:MAG: small basic family protein [Clostridia bacterium]|nr:small basic family protein [Clostridia bacterium]
MVYTILGCILGIAVGIIVPVIPYEYAKYTAVAIVAAFDSVVGAINGVIKNSFDIKIFVSGFFTNALIAILLTLLGESLDVDIFLAAIFVFATRIFTNLSYIRRELINRIETKKNEK